MKKASNQLQKSCKSTANQLQSFRPTAENDSGVFHLLHEKAETEPFGKLKNHLSKSQPLPVPPLPSTGSGGD